MRLRAILLALFILSFAFSRFAYADDVESRLKVLEEKIQEQQKVINELKDELSAIKNAPEAAAPPLAPQASAAEEKPEEKPSRLSGLYGGAAFTNPYISLILETYVYSSNLKRDELKVRGIPGYIANNETFGIDRRKGFNLDSAELFIFAPVDPYFNLYANIPADENGATVEEAYFVTTSLPYGLQVKGGRFKSGFSRINAQHPHAWDFIDTPLAYRAFIGNEGMNDNGVQLTYLPELPFYLQVGAEVLQGENDRLFGADAKGGPHAFTGFAKASFDTGDYSTILFGPSVVFGSAKNNSIQDNTTFTGNSQLFGFESVYKWKPSTVKSLIVQGEYMFRHQTGNLEDDSVIPSTVNSLKRGQDGLYVQSLYQMGRWRVGARYDLLDVFAHDYILGGENVGQGPRPWRVSSALEWNGTEFSRLRLQYNHDMSGRDGRSNDEWFLELILGIGAHAAHTF
jgi:hypothetical protein